MVFLRRTYFSVVTILFIETMNTKSRIHDLLGQIGTFLLRKFGTIFASLLTASLNPRTIQHSSDNVISNTRQVLYPSSSYHYHRVLLKIMPYSGDICRYLHTISQSDTSNFSQSRVRLLGGNRSYLKTNTSLERSRIISRSVLLVIESERQSRRFIFRLSNLSWIF